MTRESPYLWNSGYATAFPRAALLLSSKRDLPEFFSRERRAPSGLFSGRENFPTRSRRLRKVGPLTGPRVLLLGVRPALSEGWGRKSAPGLLTRAPRAQCPPRHDCGGRRDTCGSYLPASSPTRAPRLLWRPRWGPSSPRVRGWLRTVASGGSLTRVTTNRRSDSTPRASRPSLTRPVQSAGRR